MPTLLNANDMTLLDVQKAQHYTDAERFLAPLMKKNDFLNVVPWDTTSDGLVDKNFVATELGKGSWTEFNNGILATGGKEDLITETVHMYQGLSRVDDRLLNLQNGQKMRDMKDVEQLEGVTQDWLSQCLYGNDPDGIRGIFTRRSKIKKNLVWDALNGGSTSNSGKLTSMLLIEFSPTRGFCMTYPAGHAAGISSEDMGRVPIIGANGGTYWAWVRQFTITAGMRICNPKAVMRLANLDLTADGFAFPDKTFIQMKNQLPDGGTDAAAFVNRSLKAAIETYCLDKSNAIYTRGEIEGYGPVDKILGIPVLMLEAISEKETTITA